MIVFNELTEKNLFLYAAKHYKNPNFSDIDDFYEDLNYSSTKKLIEDLKKDKKPNYGSIKDRKSEPENGATVLLSIKGKVNASR